MRSILPVLHALIIVFCLLVIYIQVSLITRYIYFSHANEKYESADKVANVKYERIRPLLKTGDIMLVRTMRDGTFHNVAFNLVDNQWTHCGVVYVEDNIPYVITSRNYSDKFIYLRNYLNLSDVTNRMESKHFTGISMHRLDDEIAQYESCRHSIDQPKQSVQIGFKLLHDPCPNINQIFLDYLQANPILMYRLSGSYIFGKIFNMCKITMFNRYHCKDYRKTGIICSEITGELLRAAGLLKETKSGLFGKRQLDLRWIEPRHFESNELYSKKYYRTIYLK